MGFNSGFKGLRQHTTRHLSVTSCHQVTRLLFAELSLTEKMQRLWLVVEIFQTVPAGRKAIFSDKCVVNRSENW